MLRFSGVFGAAVAAPFWVCAVAAAEQPGVLTDVITVTAFRGGPSLVLDDFAAPQAIAWPVDSSALAARAPGGALVGNGALSGQLSYRGLAGERVLGRVNGQRFASGGPNAMDPPLHYAPSILLDRIEVARGVSPVADGPGLAGAVNAVLRRTGFSDGSDVRASGFLTAQLRSVDESHAVGGGAGVSTKGWRLGVIGSREVGEDYRFAGGTAGGTSFARSLYGVEGGFRSERAEVFFEYRRSETDPSGNPPFALDIVYFNTDFVQAGFRGALEEAVTLDVRVGRVTVRHLMDNQTVRRPAAPAMQARATFAYANTGTAEARLRFGDAARHLTIGGDMQMVDKEVRITNPFNAAFFIDSQPQVREERFGGFVEGRTGLGGAELELGVRIDRVAQTAGTPELGSAVPMGPRQLAAAFVATERSRRDTVVDVVVRAWWPGLVAEGGLTPRVTLARKTRVPSLLERFAWLPTEASYGLADGNIYVGNQALVPETAWIAEAGFDYARGGVSLRPTVFYRRVDDYIQGTPFDATPGLVNSVTEMVAGMNGDPTPLMFRNVDAELYGLDLDFQAKLTATLSVEGTASFVHAARRDVADALYRVAPANLRLAAIWARDDVALGAEMVAAAAQNRVSATNGEAASPGYAVFGVFGRVGLGERVTLEAGVENLFNRFYQPHLSGLNRTGASDVAVGERLPGAGRGAWLRASLGF
jgi:iron complex outermembrane receptor protein